MKNKIALMRINKGLSQKELAKRINVDNSHLSKVERGRVKPSLALLERIAKELDCSIKDLF